MGSLNWPSLNWPSLNWSSLSWPSLNQKIKLNYIRVGNIE